MKFTPFFLTLFFVKSLALGQADNSTSIGKIVVAAVITSFDEKDVIVKNANRYIKVPRRLILAKAFKSGDKVSLELNGEDMKYLFVDFSAKPHLDRRPSSL